MARYFIRAQPIIGRMRSLWTLLNDGTVERQEPDGGEILASMKRAVIVGGRVEWYETCYCNPPLRHERSTVYDRFFDGMEVTPLEAEVGLEGERFWDYLSDYSDDGKQSSSGTPVSIRTRYVPLRIL